MKLIICFILLLLSFSVFAEKQIVVLSSIDELPHGIKNSIDRQFNDAFKYSGYRYTIQHSVSAEKLSEYLNSDDVYALFYISHATSARSVNGIPFASSITNKDGLDVSKVFQKINSNIKYLSIIGCSAKFILDAYKERGYFHDDLSYYSFDTDVFIKSAINKSLKAGAELYDAEPRSFLRANSSLSRSQRTTRKQVIGIKGLMNQTVEEQSDFIHSEYLKVDVINKNQFEGIISVNDIFIGVLKKGKENQTFYIPNGLDKNGRIKLIVNYPKAILQTGAKSLNLQIDDQNMAVKHPTDAAGVPSGGNLNFYYLVKSSPSDSHL